MQPRASRAKTSIVALILAVSGCGSDATDDAADAQDQAATAEAPATDDPTRTTSTADSEAWIPLFNGRDLTGWTPKIRGYEAGADPLGTFTVVDGAISVGYAQYDTFDERFGHLFYEEPFSRYVLRVEYRFIGDQVPEGPGWAFKNSGVMFHSQSAESMLPDQDFPISLELQFLGGNGTDPRPTANLCTPGTHVEMADTLVERHCINADAPTIHTDEWVTVDLMVDAANRIAHVMDGDTVLAYSRPIAGGGEVAEYDEAALVEGQALSSGYIALQSESHPIQFRQVLLRRLPD